VFDPNEEALAKRFEGVRRLHLNLYAILAIEEVGVDNTGLSFDSDRSNVLMLRSPPGAGDDG